MYIYVYIYIYIYMCLCRPRSRSRSLSLSLCLSLAVDIIPEMCEVGAVAGDEHSYDTFRLLFEDIIRTHAGSTAIALCAEPVPGCDIRTGRASGTGSLRWKNEVSSPRPVARALRARTDMDAWKIWDMPEAGCGVRAS